VPPQGLPDIDSKRMVIHVRQGNGVSRFRNASAFASWLGLCPEKKISGGKVLFTKSRRVRSRVAIALRLAARSLHYAKDYMGEFFRRTCRKLGKPQAIAAARIVYYLLSKGIMSPRRELRRPLREEGGGQIPFSFKNP
jgi:hypothetical protein